MTDFTDGCVLALDTSGASLKLALQFGGDRLVKLNEPVGTSHGQILIRKIENLLESAGRDKRELDALVSCVGPGSFTGLRIGLAGAKGMAVALGIPLVGVGLFEMAAVMLRETARRVQLVAPFKRDQFFIALAQDGAVDTDRIEAVAATMLGAYVGMDPVVGIGLDILELYPELEQPSVPGTLEYEASDLLPIGIKRLNAGDIPDIATLEPAYLQKSQAEIRFDRRQKDK